MEKIVTLIRTHYLFTIGIIVSLLLTLIFYLLVSTIWHSVTEFYAIQFNNQIFSLSNNSLSEGNYFGFISSLDKIRSNGSLKNFAVVELINDERRWLFVSDQSFREKTISSYACSENPTIISTTSEELKYSALLPKNYNATSRFCLILSVTIPESMTKMKKFFYFLFCFMTFVLIGAEIYLVSQIKRKEHLFELKKKEREIEVLSEVYTLAEQLSHDIRSPLSVINILISSISSIQESHKKLLADAVKRINDIANGMLKNFKEISSAEIDVEREKEVKNVKVVIVDLIEKIISEKKILFDKKVNLTFNIQNEGLRKVLVNINPDLMSRVLSNILNNSYEALNFPDGEITLDVRKKDEFVVINIVDNGKGIPDEILNRIGEKKITYGKNESNQNSGSGIGLFNAARIVKSFQGKIEFKSKVSVGTEIAIYLPVV